jgi:GTP-binding protein HflX
MFERPQAGERALLLHVDTGDGSEGLDKFVQLAESAGAEVVDALAVTRTRLDPRLLIGQGKAAELAGRVADDGVDVLLVNHPLSPSQERNLERELKCRVLDRTGLILDIFAQRARTHEGKLQVELAQLRHMATRLVRGWTHLERQKGGIGLRGPGETQLETDRRLLDQRVRQIRRRLERVDRQRSQGRRGRQRVPVPTVSLVGYTNAGKSTLFNRLTGAGVYAADQLFATLDPTLRRIEQPQRETFVLADTVGFISDLPHELVAAFRSTLQETCEAQLLLHVVDAAAPDHLEAITQVEAVLREIGAEEVPQIAVYNKLDLLDDGEPRVDRDADGRVLRVWCSASSGAGIDLLLEAVQAFLSQGVIRHRLRLPPSAGRVRARLFDSGRVLGEKAIDTGGWLIEVEMPRGRFDRLARQEGLEAMLDD